jgi:predicted glycogen debranching enzyme
MNTIKATEGPQGELPCGEWFASTGSGAFGYQTVSTWNERKQHGLFISPTSGLFNRYLYVSNLHDTFRWNGGELNLSSFYFRETISPDGYCHIVSFSHAPNPRWLFGKDGIFIRKTLIPIPGEHSLVIKYTFLPPGEGTLTIRPILGLRYLHDVRSERDFPLGIRYEKAGVFSLPGEAPVPPISIIAPGAAFLKDFHWYKHFHYSLDEGRGEAHYEDLPSPGYFTHHVKEGIKDYYLLLSTEKRWKSLLDEGSKKHLTTIRKALRKKRFTRVRKNPRLFQKSFDPLESSALSLLQERDGVLLPPSGFPYYQVNIFELLHFVRDFLLRFGHITTSAKIIESIRPYLRRGLLPKYISEDGSPLYCSADTSLLFIEVVYRYMRLLGQRGEWKQWFPVIEEIIGSFMEGTDYSIQMDRDFLINACEDGIESTWMDRVRGDEHIAPRHGKAVDVNALWYNGLCLYRDLLMASGRKKVAHGINRMIPRVKRSFLQKFTLEREGYLADVVRESGHSRDLRPNQLYALVLTNPVISPTFGKRILYRIKGTLLTSHGLKSLDPSSPGYRGNPEGGEISFTEALYNGGILPHLSLLYCEALVYVHGPNNRTINQMKRFLLSLRKIAEEHTPCYLPEAFERDPPHKILGSPVSLISTGALLGLFRLYETTLQLKN